MAQIQQNGIQLKVNTQVRRALFYGTAGQVPSVIISKNGAAFGAAQGVVTEVANGHYYIDLTVADTSVQGPLLVHVTATAGGPLDYSDTVVSQIFTDMLLDGSGNVSITSNTKKSTRWQSVPFPMTDSNTHALKSGIAGSISVQRSIDGGAYAALTDGINSATEIGTSGTYVATFETADTNGSRVLFLATATGCDPTLLEFITQP